MKTQVTLPFHARVKAWVSTRGPLVISAGTTLLVLGLLSIAAAPEPVRAQAKIVPLSKVRPKDVVGVWQFDLHAVDAPHELRMVETLTFDARGTGRWVMVPTDKTHPTWAHKFTWFAGDGLIAISLASLKTRLKAVRSKDTMYAIVSRDRKAVLLTSEPGRVERFERKATH